MKGFENVLKRFIILICFILLMVIKVPLAFAINNPRNIYEVNERDYLWEIATTYRTTVQDLKLINGLQSETLYAGQKIRVPIMYQVIPGDTIWKLSQTFNSTVPLIIKTANGLKNNTLTMVKN
ncbi:LysM peptidoglycan-binding domain-containing protein [Peribacillus sp. SCS-26]|uniref:LysM peptidoglycan-binding domain-containing protein n=1 Tax=Paraperibacillus marinus TaxID=3115295 RepID=UPI003905EE20